ncbi:hypothetical protein ALC53_01886 [Atta colombica]|uniref:Uncharacterized protein n=1 Tax=Atta colombica TaxID=520822 RepID=A0A151I5X5_9HYME|nr:hypothetical protein ALC53_01886 [Atta colombica]
MLNISRDFDSARLIGVRKSYIDHCDKYIELCQFFEDAREIVFESHILNLINSVVAALHPAKKYMERKSSYLHDDESQDDNVRHFALIKDLSRLVSSQLSKKAHKKYFCDRLNGKLNNCAIRLRRQQAIELQQAIERSRDSSKNSEKHIVYNLYFRSMFLWQILCEMIDKSLTTPRYVCEKPFALMHGERNHCYLTGRYRGPAHSKCNFIIKDIATVYEGRVDLLLIIKEKYISFTKHVDLTDDTISESDYAYAADVWQRFSIRNLGEHSNLYLKIDVLLLADVFENFHDSCELWTRPRVLHLHRMPKHTNIKFELLIDIDMVMFIERSIRSGLNRCPNRYARTNDKYMSSHDPSKASVDDMQNFDFTTIAIDSSTGYVLEKFEMKFDKKCEIMYTDTNSLIYHIEEGKKDTKKTKDIKGNVVTRSIMFEDYTRLNDAVVYKIETTRVYMIAEKKITLSPHDNKRYSVPDSTDTLPWGHYKILL